MALLAALRVIVPVLYVADQIHSFHVVRQLWLQRCAEERADAAARRDRALTALFRRVTARCLPQDAKQDVAVTRQATAPGVDASSWLALAAADASDPAPPPTAPPFPPPRPVVAPSFVPDEVAPFVALSLAVTHDALASVQRKAKSHLDRWHRVSALRFSCADAAPTPGRRRRRTIEEASIERVLLD